MDMPAAEQLVQFCNLYATQQGIHLQHEMCMPCMHSKRVAQNLARVMVMCCMHAGGFKHCATEPYWDMRKAHRAHQ